MSYPSSPSEQTGTAPDGTELAVDLGAFLPEGVALAPAEPAPPAEPAAPAEAVDIEALAQIERDLDAVDAAIAALDAGTYGLDPVTGDPIDDAVLAADPTRLS